MKHQILGLLLVGATLQSLAQGNVVISKGSYWISSGAITFDNTHLKNDGVANLSKSTVTFKGDRFLEIKGTNTIQFGTLVAKNLEALELNQNVDLLHRLELDNSNLDIKSYVVDFKTTGTLVGETTENRIYGTTGTLVRVGDIPSNTIFDLWGLGGQIKIINAIDSNNNNIRVSRGVRAPLVNNRSSIRRYLRFEGIEIEKTDSEVFLKLPYYDREVPSSTNLSTLQLWNSEQSIFWQEMASTLNPSEQYLTVENIKELNGYWTIAESAIKSTSRNSNELGKLEANLFQATVFPNPSNGDFSVRLNSLSSDEVIHIQIITSKGELIFEKEFMNQSLFDFYLEDLPEATYKIVVKQGSKIITKSLLITQK